MAVAAGRHPLPPSFAARLTAVAVSLLLFAVGGELVCRLLFAVRMSYDVEMTRYATLLKQPAADPRIGHVHRPGSRATLMGVTVEINEHGLRGPPVPPAGEAVERIVFLGDSLTFGWGVEEDRTFARRLERRLSRRRPTQVLNLGIGNTNTSQQVALFAARGLELAPDRVVLFYFVNDAEPTPSRSRWAFLGHSRLATFLWSRVHAAASRLSPARSFVGYYRGLYGDDQPGWRETRRALVELTELCRQEEIGLQVVLLPELHELADYPFAAEHARVAAVLERLGVPTLDLAPAFGGVEDPRRLWVAADDAHPNARAHRLIAEHSFEFLAGDPR